MPRSIGVMRRRDDAEEEALYPYSSTGKAPLGFNKLIPEVGGGVVFLVIETEYTGGFPSLFFYVMLTRNKLSGRFS